MRQNAYGEVIPACHRAILDEAHQLEDIATQYFGYSLSTYRVEELARDIERSLDHRAGRAASGDTTAAPRTNIAKAIEQLRDYARAFFSDLAFAHRGGDRGSEGAAPRAREAKIGSARPSIRSAPDVGRGSVDLSGASRSSSRRCRCWSG